MPSSAPVICDADGVAELEARVRSHGRFALDFEFLWERTYRPVPCLAQIAVGDDVVIVDPVAGAPLDAIARLVADPAVETVMHAPSADLTLLVLHFDCVPTNVIDVQLLAGFVGLGAGQSLGTLLERVLHIKLAKAESYSDWSKRPLSAAQLDYAADDVRHLLALHTRFAEQADALGRADWVAEEHERRYGPDARFTTDPDEAWRKIKGQGRLTPRERAVLKALAAWREREAMQRDRPTGWILQDRIMIDMARRQLRTENDLQVVRGAEKLRPQQAQAILDAVRAGTEAPEIHVPRTERPDLQGRVEVLGALGQLLVAVRASAVKLAAPLVATRDDVESYLTATLDGNGADHALASGWRYDLVGAALHDLALGRLALAPTDTHPYLVEITQSGDG